jgi:hypothetical protein
MLALLPLTWACTVWKTDRGCSSSGEDETRIQNGQPYYLPKGLLHLTIKKSSGDEEVADEPASSGKGGKAATGKADEEQVDESSGNVLTAAPGNTQSSSGNASGGGKSYTVSLGVEHEADATAGVFYARYSPNWLFKDQVGIQVNNKRLLHCVQTKTKDETKTVLNNVMDTVTNVIRFGATKGMTGFSTGRTTEGEQPARGGESLRDIKNVVVKELNIDERFDPLDPQERERVTRMFDDEIGKNYAVLSPFRIEFHLPEGLLGIAKKVRGGERQGLYFREPAQVEVVLKRNPLVFEYAREMLSKLVELSHLAEDELRSAEAGHKTAKKNAAGRKKEAESVKPIPADDAAITAAQGQGNGQPNVPAEDDEVTEADDAAKEAKARYDAVMSKLADMEKLYYRAQPGASATVGRMSAVVLNKQRLYTLDIKRSAFVERTTQLQIDNGVVMGIGHDKPSEVKGFTEIPLELTKKLLELPKAIFTSKKEVATERKEFLNAQQSGN